MKQFLIIQYNVIERHVSQFPIHERDQRRMQWIENNAENFRVAWDQGKIGPDSTYTNFI